MKLALIIPCYNEKENIPFLIKSIQETFKARKEIEVILVDNGSTDGSVQLLDTALHNLDILRLVKIPKNYGYGFGILSGLASATDADVLAWTHADLQTDLKDVLVAFDLFCSQSTDRFIVKGKRRNRKMLDRFLSYSMQCIASVVLGVKLDDINAQPKVFSRHFFECYVKDNAPKDFSLDLFLLYCAIKANLEVLSVPVEFNQRCFGVALGGGGSELHIRKKLIMRSLNYIFELGNRLNRNLKK